MIRAIRLEVTNKPVIIIGYDRLISKQNEFQVYINIIHLAREKTLRLFFHSDKQAVPSSTIANYSCSSNNYVTPSALNRPMTSMITNL